MEVMTDASGCSITLVASFAPPNPGTNVIVDIQVSMHVRACVR
jgi:hypothetical protein